MLKKIIIFILSSLVLFIMADLFLLISEIQTPHFSMIDPVKGKVNIPDRKILFVSEGFYMGGTNSQGYWGPAYDTSKDENTIRIALLGNSFVEGIQVFEKYHFRHLLEKNLNDVCSKKIEVLNFGKGRNSLSDMYYSYIHMVSHYNPDIVLFFIDHTSDNIGARAGADMAPFYFIENGELKIDYSFREAKSFKLIQSAKFFLKNSALTRLIYNCYKTYSHGNAPNILLDKFAKIGNKESHSEMEVETHLDLDAIVSRLFLEIMKPEGNFIVFNPRDNASIPDGFSELVPPNRLIDLRIPIDSLLSLEINPNYWEVSHTIGHWNHVGHQAVANYLSDQIFNYLESESKVNESGI